MIYGYARISRSTQNIDRQIRNISEYAPTAKIIAEAYTGTTQERPEWCKLLKRLKPNDTIIFDSVSRMSRNAEEGIEEYEKLYNQEINLVFLKEHQIDTETYRSAISQQIEMTGNEIADEFIKAINNVLMILAKKQIYLSFEQAQKEVDDLHKRTSEGIKTAKLRGKQVGRPVGAEIVSKKSVSAKQIILQHSKDFGGTLNDADVLKLIGNISRNTYYKYKKELKK